MHDILYTERQKGISLGGRRWLVLLPRRVHILPLPPLRRHPLHPGVPGGIVLQGGLVANHDEPTAGAGDGDIQAALVRQKAHPPLCIAAEQAAGRHTAAGSVGGCLHANGFPSSTSPFSNGRACNCTRARSQIAATDHLTPLKTTQSASRPW